MSYDRGWGEKYHDTVDGGRWMVDGGWWMVDGGRWTVDPNLRYGAVDGSKI